MKISEFSETSGIPIDTIRYYISLGLLIPEKKDSRQFLFNEKDLADILEIKHLKELGFSIKEIETMMRLNRTSSVYEPMLAVRISSIYERKKIELQKKQKWIKQALLGLNERLDSIRNSSAISSTREMGVPLRAVSILKCPHCRRSLRITQATFSEKYILEGCLLCECGYSAAVENGVIVTGNLYTAPYDSPDVNRNIYNTLCDELFFQYQQCSQFILKELQQMDLKNKIILEGNINGYFFLYKNLEYLPKDCLVIIVDKFQETVDMYKDLLERMNIDRDILFIADADTDLPIDKKCVNILIDFHGSNEWMLYHEDTFEEDISDYLAERCEIVGTYVSLPSFAKTKENLMKKYPESSSRSFSVRSYKDALSGMGFTCDMIKSGEILHTQNSYAFSCHVDGEPYTYYKVHAKR